MRSIRLRNRSAEERGALALARKRAGMKTIIQSTAKPARKTTVKNSSPSSRPTRSARRYTPRPVDNKHLPRASSDRILGKVPGDISMKEGEIRGRAAGAQLRRGCREHFV